MAYTNLFIFAAIYVSIFHDKPPYGKAVERYTFSSFVYVKMNVRFLS